MKTVDVDAFLEQLDEAAGPPPVFSMQDGAAGAMDQFYEWIKWSGKKSLAGTMRERMLPTDLGEG